MTTSGPDERLSAYYDGELSAAERAEVERLLTERSDLRNELSGLADLSLRLNDLAEELPDFDLRARVLTQIENARRNLLPIPVKSHVQRYPQWMPLLLTACSLMLLIAVSLPLLSTSVSSPQLAQHETMFAKAAGPAAAIVNVTAPGQVNEAVLHNEPLGLNTTVVSSGSGVSTSEKSIALSMDADHADAANQDGNGPSVVLAQIERTRGLNAGEIISRMIESDNTPMLAEYTVVDVRRSAQVVEVLLKEHGIQPLASPESDSLFENKPIAARDHAESPLKVYLLDAESVSLNKAIMEFKDLQEVVATNVGSFEMSPYAEANVTGTTQRYLPSLGFSRPPEDAPDSALFGSPAPQSPYPSAAAATSAREMQGKKDAGDVTSLQNPPRTPITSSTSTDEKNDAAAAAAPTRSVIAGNSLVVGNSEEVYSELQQLLSQPKHALENRGSEPVAPSRSVPSGAAESKSKGDLNAATRPESRKMSLDLRSQNSTPQQVNRSRQRAFLVLRSQSQSQAPAQPPAPPQQEPLKSPE